MLTAARALGRAASKGHPLPEVAALSPLYSEWNCHPARAQVTMIAGMSGSQKSGLALWWVMEMNLPTLYFSADMDSHTATVRSAAKATGTVKDAVARGLDGPGEGFYIDSLERYRIQWCFNSAPTLDDISDEIAAYVEAYDHYPEVVVVDNLMNCEAETEGDYQGMKLIMSELHSLARLTGAAVFVLHHMQEGSQRDTTLPCAKRDLQQKVSQLPEVILSVALDNATNQFRMAVVKSRSAKQDPTGKTFLTLQAQPECNEFVPYVHPAYGGYGGWNGESE